MEVNVKKVVMFSILLLCCVVLFAGPFGLEMGWTIDEVKSNGAEVFFNQGDVYIIKPPKVHNSFDIYFVEVSPDFGVYRISAMAENIETSSNGDKLLSEYNKIKDHLSMSYGEPDIVINRLDYGSIWDEPQDFMMSLVLDERVVLANWVSSDATEKMKIGLMASADSPNSGSILLFYASENSDIADSQDEAMEASIL